ncbi:hypothetical protein AB0M54_39830 [Actinoplanes sp. NPDC051470]|uniref:hypothetical protein n=1 Tax=unclassified Actinoplanes TaxID=2626549 RepID=UPI003423F4C0
MRATTPYAQYAVEAPSACRDAAADIGARLRALRAHLAGLDPQRLGLTGARYADLLAGYDIYARMLDDALHDIAGDLERAAGTTGRSDLEPAGGHLR